MKKIYIKLFLILIIIFTIFYYSFRFSFTYENFKIKNDEKSKCLEIKNNKLIATNCKNNKQNWIYEKAIPNSNVSSYMRDFYYIKQYDPNIDLSYCLTYDTSTNMVITTECNNNNNQIWRIKNKDDTIRSLKRIDYCMALQNDNTLKMQICNAEYKTPISHKWYKI